ncbi:hypothetical protein TanjilG_07669 [Lupinus angustifolius]|uniref:Encoded peptide n=1 Tax=Lupinus angustifolius TaxID=3871 RepID=A0A1J7G0G1_LUPAN|nr:hypothetical protein TanjilG_07669 [Lupinus angustifolius]
MANFTQIFFIFVLMFLSHELLHIEARNLRQSFESQNASSIMDETKSAFATSPSQTNHGTRRMMGEVSAFRPTTPGNSPGVGHSINN